MSATPTAQPQDQARILERGYRRFAGRRKGPGEAVWSLALHSMQRSLGLRRTARYKIVPILTLVLSYLPAVVFIGLVAFVPAFKGALPTYSQYYGFVGNAVLLFCAFVGPEAICPDRRSGVLSLYMASPLTRGTYLASKALSLAMVILIVTLGPPLLLLSALTIQGAGPKGFADFVIVLLRVGGSGLMLAIFFTALTLAFSSLTDRRGYATGGFLMAVLLTGVSTGILVGGLRAPRGLLLANLGGISFELVQRIFGEPGNPIHGERGHVVGQPLPMWWLIGAVAGWTLAAAALVAVRYRRLQVTR